MLLMEKDLSFYVVLPGKKVLVRSGTDGTARQRGQPEERRPTRGTGLSLADGGRWRAAGIWGPLGTVLVPGGSRRRSSLWALGALPAAGRKPRQLLLSWRRGKRQLFLQLSVRARPATYRSL